MAKDPKQIVARGFDQIGERYVQWARHSRVQERERYTSFVIDHLPPGSRVLDLGCGAGIPTTGALAHHFTVTGVDISPRQIELARQKVPQARFLQEDFSRLDFAPASFDAVVAFYSLFCIISSCRGRGEKPSIGWKRSGSARDGAHRERKR